MLKSVKWLTLLLFIDPLKNCWCDAEIYFKTTAISFEGPMRHFRLAFLANQYIALEAILKNKLLDIHIYFSHDKRHTRLYAHLSIRNVDIRFLGNHDNNLYACCPIYA